MVIITNLDWRKALQSPPPYRMGNGTLRIQIKVMSYIITSGIIVLIILMFYTDNIKKWSSNHFSGNSNLMCNSREYNSTYPLTSPIIIQNSPVRTYRIGAIADLDKNSISSNKKSWTSYFKKGFLSYNSIENSIVIDWDPKDNQLDSQFSFKNRGMELSELVTYNGKLLTFCDHTGIVFNLIDDHKIVEPWIILNERVKSQIKGFKSEWATLKDNYLYVGSMGKEWTTPSGEFLHNNPMYIKIISMNGEVKNVDWIDNYKKLRSSLNIEWPGYLLHESGHWSSYHSKWFFLPRRCSYEKYNETTDEIRGCDKLLIANEDFSSVQVVKVNNPNPTHGFSSFKFIPGTNDYVIVAIITEEFEGATTTYITAFTIDGKEILAPEKISNYKLEGFEFI